MKTSEQSVNLGAKEYKILIRIQQIKKIEIAVTAILGCIEDGYLEDIGRSEKYLDPVLIELTDAVNAIGAKLKANSQQAYEDWIEKANQKGWNKKKWRKINRVGY